MAVADNHNLVRELVRAVDPRRSLTAAAVWLIVTLAASFALVASLWVAGLARDIVVQQHVRRLMLETDQLGSDIEQAIGSRLGAIRVVGALLDGPAAAVDGTRLRAVFERLVAAYPDLEWRLVADREGRVLTADGAGPQPAAVATMKWFREALVAPWIGPVQEAAGTGPASVPGPTSLGEIAAPLASSGGEVVGVIVARLSWRAPASHLKRLNEAVGPQGSAEALLIDPEGRVRVGPLALRDRPWPGRKIRTAPGTGAEAGASGLDGGGTPAPQFERLPDGRVVLVARSTLADAGVAGGGGWRVQLSEPIERVYARADALTRQIIVVSLMLGAATAIAGAIGARRLTGRLRALTASVARVGQNAASEIDVPAGRDEVTRLGHAFAGLLGALQSERAELTALSQNLERRVVARTREVERLAEESRYAAINRERLRLARDLHDTLAHSMMAMLSEVRLLRRLYARESGNLADELARAEAVAQEGLNEARRAIAQIRTSSARETGLGPALANLVNAFANHTGLSVEFDVRGATANFGDERAETILSMAAEVLRNVERHARANRVAVMLREAGDNQYELSIGDDGVGFDVGQEHAGHYGLVGLHEQAELIGATLRIESAAQCGTTVTLRWPVSGNGGAI